MSQNLSFLFRVDAGPTIGAGHLVRCLALADELCSRHGTKQRIPSQNKCVFAGTAETYDLLKKLRQTPLDFIALQTSRYDDTSFLNTLAHTINNRFSYAIVDHYHLNAEFERELRSVAERVVAIDDAPARPHDADLIIDQTLSRMPEEYVGVTPSNALILTGTDYCMLRPQFREARNASLSRRDGQIKHILVSLGLTRSDHIEKAVLEGLHLALFSTPTSSPILIDFIATSMPDHKTSLEQMFNDRIHTTVHTDVKDMADLYKKADLVIGAPGMSSWERCTMGVPSVLVIMADNQKDNAMALEASGAAMCLDWRKQQSPQDLADVLEVLLENPQKVLQMGQRASKCCDGAGTRRIADVLEQVALQDNHQQDTDLMNTSRRHISNQV